MHMDSIPSPFPPESDTSGIAASRGEEAAGEPTPGRLAALVAENIELRAEIDQLKADRRRMADIQIRLMEVLNCKSPDRLVHDMRNALNERELYRALADSAM